MVNDFNAITLGTIISNNFKLFHVTQIGIRYINIAEKYDINITDEHGRTAKIIAAGRNDLEMLEILVDPGTKLDVEDKFGSTPLKKAEKNKNPIMINFIKEKLNPSPSKNCIVC